MQRKLRSFNKLALEQEYWQQQYVATLQAWEDKDYVAAYLKGMHVAKKLPQSKRIWSLIGQALEKCNFIGSAKRSFVIGLHVHPQETEAIEQLMQFTLVHGPHNGQAEELRFRQLLFQPNDFDLRLHYFKQLMAKDEEQAFAFAMNYFVGKYVKQVDVAKLREQAKESEFDDIVLLTSQQLAEFKTIADEFVKMNQLDMASQIYVLAVRLAPSDANMYYTLYELNLKQGKYLDAFKAFLHYMHFSSSIGADQYQVLADLLFKAKYYMQSLLAYHQVYKETQDPKILLFIQQELAPHLQLSAEPLPELSELSLLKNT